jgi:hypothetical protein
LFYANHRGEYTYRATAAPFGRSVAADDEPLATPTPRYGRVPPRPGNWRTDAKRRIQPRKRLSVRPTGGAVERSPRATPKRRRRVARTVAPTASALHAAWSKGHDVI